MDPRTFSQPLTGILIWATAWYNMVLLLRRRWEVGGTLSMQDVIGFGAINLDMIYLVDSLTEVSGDGIEFLPGREFCVTSEVFSRALQRVEQMGVLKTESGGGSAANTIVALSRLGFNTGFIGKVGRDSEGRTLLAQMEGVDLRGIVSEGMSGRCLCVLDAKQDRSIFLETNTNDTLSSEEIDFRYATNTRYVHLTSFAGEKPFLAQMALADRVCPPTRISFDPGEVYACRGLEYLKPLLERSFIVFVTETEVEMLTGLNLLDGSQRLLELGPSIILCKKGEAGVHIVSCDEWFDLPAERAEVLDNTGAGDVFNAGFLAGILTNRPLKDCACFGTRLAARSLTGYGRSRYPEKQDLAFFQECQNQNARRLPGTD